MAEPKATLPKMLLPKLPQGTFILLIHMAVPAVKKLKCYFGIIHSH